MATLSSSVAGLCSPRAARQSPRQPKDTRGAKGPRARVTVVQVRRPAVAPSCPLVYPNEEGATCPVPHTLDEGPSCPLVLGSDWGRACPLALAPAALAPHGPLATRVPEETVGPTTVLPTGVAMAEMLKAYCSLLDAAHVSGDVMYGSGKAVLERIKLSLTGLLLGHPLNSSKPGAEAWRKSEGSLGISLWSIENDLQMLRAYHQHEPEEHFLHLARVHCLEAETLLQRL